MAHWPVDMRTVDDTSIAIGGEAEPDTGRLRSIRARLNLIAVASLREGRWGAIATLPAILGASFLERRKKWTLFP
jgi:hypothetical protein